MWQTTFGYRIYTSPAGLDVYQNIAYRWLSFSKPIIQTLINRRHPEQGGLQYIKQVTGLILAMPGDCCLLGLGGAGVAHALFPSFSAFRLTAVEASQEVIDIATTYFYLSRIHNLTILHQRAEHFVQSSTQRYTTLLVDLHDGTDFPTTCMDATFWQHCLNRLRPDGMMIVNLLNAGKKLSLFNTIQQIFPGNTLVLPITNSLNTLIVAYHPAFKLVDIPHQSLLSNLFWDEHWGWVGKLGRSK